MGASLKLRLLLIAFYFPPIGWAGSQRPAKFANYLAELGWNVRVIAPRSRRGRG